MEQPIKHSNSPDYWLILLCQSLVASFIRHVVLRFTNYTIRIDNVELDRNKIYVIAANHQHGDDPFVANAVAPIAVRSKLLPIKFMTKNRFYFTWWRPAAFMMGCFPARQKDEGHERYGVAEAIRVGKLGYRIWIFPEGKVTKPGEERAHSGVSRILEGLPEAELILCHVKWINRRGNRRRLHVRFKLADETIDRNNPQQILDAIYSL
ncbi:MAG TPA: 1-acyl-sn-glycerol-3-phosphate acyltransferase [Candidatus Saccharimonadales bacterium]|nr:1-acyl-sn-glycerol-3-phosphate acyltransferase [Candidatus Saccharimonadales bacterium]